jgi:hypothetical protein
MISAADFAFKKDQQLFFVNEIIHMQETPQRHLKLNSHYFTNGDIQQRPSIEACVNHQSDFICVTLKKMSLT